MLLVRPIRETYWGEKTKDTQGSLNPSSLHRQWGHIGGDMLVYRGRAWGEPGFQATLQPTDPDGHAFYVIVMQGTLRSTFSPGIVASVWSKWWSPGEEGKWEGKGGGRAVRESEISPLNSRQLHGMEEFPSCLSQKCGVDSSAGNVPLEKGHQQSCPRKGYRVELHCRVRKVWHKPASRSFISVLASLRELWVWEDQSAWWAFKAQGCLFPYTSYPPLFQSSVDNCQLGALSLSLCTFRSPVPGCWEIYLSYFKKALAVGCCRVTGTMLGTSSFASGPLCSSDQVCPAPAGTSLHFWFDCHAVFTRGPLTSSFLNYKRKTPDNPQTVGPRQTPVIIIPGLQTVLSQLCESLQVI